MRLATNALGSACLATTANAPAALAIGHALSDADIRTIESAIESAFDCDVGASVEGTITLTPTTFASPPIAAATLATALVTTPMRRHMLSWPVR